MPRTSDILLRHARLACATLSAAMAALLAPAVAQASDTASSTMWGSVPRVVDGDASTYWQSGTPPKAGDWVMLDRGAVKMLSTIDLYMAHAHFPGERIERGTIELSRDKQSWSPLGAFAHTDEVHLAAPVGTQARYVRVRVTGTQPQKAVLRELALDRQLASTSIAPALAVKPGAMTDDDPLTFWKSAGAPTPTQSVALDQGRPVLLGRISLLMAGPQNPGARIEAGVIEVSSDQLEWNAVGEFAGSDAVLITPPPGTVGRYVRARPTAAQLAPLAVREFSAITPPPQPTSGPGGSGYAHGTVQVTAGGSGPEAWYVFEPADPTPATAPLAIIMHGYGEYSGYKMHEELIRHTVRQGQVVIYPRYQTGLLTPCLGPFNIQPCLDSAAKGVKDALAHLQADPTRVQPELGRTSYFGHSFGGIITVNLLNRHAALGLPVPRAVFLDDPHDGGYAGRGEPAVDKSLAGIPPTTLFECHVGANGVIGEPNNENTSCNAIVPKLAHIPPANKAIVLSYTDTHGSPDLSSAHGVSTGPAYNARAVLDAYDWNLVWKIWDSLRSAADDGKYREFALSDTPEHRSLGLWSDGVPVTPLKVQHEAPVRP